MKEKLKEIEVKYSTFSNFNISNIKTNVSSMVNQMNETEYHNIKLISKNSNSSKDEIDKVKYVTSKNQLGFPLVKIKNKSTKKRNDNKIGSNPFAYNKNKALISIYNKNIITKNITKISLNRNNMITPMNSSNKIFNKTINSNEIPKEIKDYKKSLNFDKNEKNYKTLINFKYNDQKNIHSQKRLRNKNNNLIDKIDPYNYYMTSRDFISTSDSIKKKKSCKDINNFLDRLNNNKPSSNKTFKYRNFNLNYNAQKFINTVNNSYKGVNNANNNNINNIIKLKKIPKIKLNGLKLLELENNLKEAYNNNFNEINQKKKDIKKEKEKCKHMLGELDKQNNYDIQQIIEEINSHLLGLNFNDFYNYLLTILKNYDKKIVNWSFDIIEDKKECPEELKFINVRHRHQKF